MSCRRLLKEVRTGCGLPSREDVQRRPACAPVSGGPVAGFPSAHMDAVGNWLPDLAKKGVFVQFSISVLSKNCPRQQYDATRLPCLQPTSQVTDPGGHPSQGAQLLLFFYLIFGIETKKSVI